MRRGRPELLVATLILLLLGSYVWYTHSVSTTSAPTRGGRATCTRASFTRSATRRPAPRRRRCSTSCDSIRNQGVPLHPDRRARELPAGHANLPFEPTTDTVPNDDPRVASVRRRCSRQQHPPIVDSLIGKIYYGDSPVVNGAPHHSGAAGRIRAAFCCSPALHHSHARQTRRASVLWAGMARESAHQLGTPLSSLRGWIELLEERGDGRHVAVGGRAHARRSRATRSRRASLRAHRTRAEVRAGRRRRDRRADRRDTSRRAFRRSPTRSPSSRRSTPSLRDRPRRSRAARVGARGADEERHRRARRSRRHAFSCRPQPRPRRRRRHLASPTTDRAFRASSALASSSRASRRSRAAGASASRSPSASSRRITAAHCVLAPTTQGATFEIILH